MVVFLVVDAVMVGFGVVGFVAPVVVGWVGWWVERSGVVGWYEVVGI